MSECVYQVSTSENQKVILGFMGASLVVNFGIVIWWLRLYCYKRNLRKREEQAEFEEYPDESDTEDIEMDKHTTGKEAEEEEYQQQKPTAQPD